MQPSDVDAGAAPTAPFPVADVKVRYLHELWREFPPSYATAHSAGFDLRACLTEDEIAIPAGGRAAVPAGLAIEIASPGVAAFVFARSGLGARDGLTVAQGVGLIDPDYRGEIVVWLLNTSAEARVVRRGERIAQLVLLPYVTARLIPTEQLGETARGAGGFGHTGTI